MRYVIGLDIGTTGTKAMLVGDDGKIKKTAYRGYGLIKRGGRIFQDAKLWLSAAEETVKECSQGHESAVAGISVSSQGGTTVWTDGSGEPVCAAVSWMDSGSAEIKAELEKEDIDWRGITGWELDPTLCLCKIKEFGLRGAEKLLTTSDCIYHALTGKFVTDPSDAAMTQLFCVGKCKWDERLIKLAGLTDNNLPDIVATGSFIGNITPAFAAKTGLSENTAVFAGAHDQYCAAYGVGICNEGDLLIATGTAWVTLAIYGSVPSQGCFGAHVAEGLYGSLIDIPSAGVCMEWIKDNFCEKPLAEIDKAASEKTDTPLFIPRFTSAKGAAVTGLRLSHDKYSLAKAVMEGVCMEVRAAVEKYPQINTVTVTGGATASRLWMKILSSVLGREINVITEKNIACVGAALTAGKALGLFDSISLGRQTVSEPAKYENKYREFLMEIQA